MSSRQNDVGGTEYAAAIAAQQPEKSPLSPVQEEAPMEKPNAFAEMVASMPDANTTPLPGLHHAIDAMYERVNAAQLAQEELDRQIPDDATLEFYLDVIAGEKHPPRCHHHPQSGCSCIAPYIARLRAALPALLEASRLIEQAREESYVFQETIELKELRIVELESQLSGSISERETLTAQLLDFENREGACCPEDVGFEEYIATLQAAVARLTTELEKFRDWFQNAEQARAVAEAKLKDAEDCDTDYRASLQQAEAEIARLTTEKAKYDADLAAAAGELLVPIPEAGTDAARMLIANWLLKSQLEAAKQFREQAIQDIETLPSSAVGCEYHETEGYPFGIMRESPNGDWIPKSAVLSIVRGSNG